jgi:hypothetical protein
MVRACIEHDLAILVEDEECIGHLPQSLRGIHIDRQLRGRGRHRSGWEWEKINAAPPIIAMTPPTPTASAVPSARVAILSPYSAKFT